MGNNQSQEIKKVTVEPVQVTQDGSTKVVPAVVVVTNNATPSTPVIQAQKPFSIKPCVECITDSLLSVGPWIRRQKQQLANSQIATTWRQTKNYINSEIQSPLCNLYNTIPEKLTDAKFELITPYTYNQRFAVVNILCALTAIATITTSRVNPASRLLRTTRNAGFMYLFGGLLIAPQIYNPFIRSY